MAVAKAPSYSSYNRRKKPSMVMSKKKPLSFNSTAPRPKPRPVAPASRPAALTPGIGKIGAAAPPPPTLQAVPSIASSGAPVSLSSQSDRISAREGYGLGMNTINRGLMDAALRYGGVNSIQQFGLDAAGKDTSSALGVTTNPEDNSALSVILRNAGLQSKNIDESSGAENTFFSSRRLEDLQKVNSDADRQRAAAKQEYDAAIADYISQLTGLRSSRDESFRNADIADIQAAIANAPTNQIPQPGAALPTPAAASPKKAAVKAPAARAPAKKKSTMVMSKKKRV